MGSLPRTTRFLAGAALAVLLGTAANAQGNSKFRPLDDFLLKQGTWDATPAMIQHPEWFTHCTVPPTTSPLWWPPVGNYVGWGNEAPSTAWAIVDYAGVAYRYLRNKTANPIDLGTTFDGYIKEDPVPGDASARLVTVELRTRNALSFASPWYPSCWSFDLRQRGCFGYRADGDPYGPDVAHGAPPALGDCYFHLVFVTHNNGGALPDLIQAFYDPAPSDVVDFLVMKFEGTAKGDLRGYPAGTQGMLHLTQIGIFTKTNSHFPGWTAELVEIKKVGK